jgi:hypothetical protein
MALKFTGLAIENMLLSWPEGNIQKVITPMRLFVCLSLSPSFVPVFVLSCLTDFSSRDEYADRLQT